MVGAGRGAAARARIAGLSWKVPGSALVLLVFVLPVAAFLLLAFSPRLFGQGPQWLTLSSFSGAFTGLEAQGVLNSLWVGCASAAASVVVATTIAWFQLRHRLPLSRLWTVFLWVCFLLPTFLAAEGWQFFLAPHGLWTRAFGFDPAGLRSVVIGPLGVVWILAVRGVPFAYFAIAGAVAGLGREFEDAGRTHGGRWWRTLRLQVGMLAPALWAAFALVFAESISDFGVASTLAVDAQFPIATYTIYQETQTIPISYTSASAFSWSLLLLVAGAVLLQRLSLRRRSFAVLSGRSRPVRRKPLSPAAAAGIPALFAGFFVLAIGIPVIGIVATSLLPEGSLGLGVGRALTLKHYWTVLHSASMTDPVLLSLKLALACGTLAAVAGTLLCVLLTEGARRLSRTLLDILLLALVGMPAIIIATGFIFAYDLPAVDAVVPIYGTMAMLMVGYVADYSPIVTRMLTGVFDQVHRTIYEAARIHGRGPVTAWVRAVLPLILPSLLTAWLFVVGGIVFELPVSDVLHPPGTPPLSVAITVLARTDYADGTAVTVMAVLGTLLLLGLMTGLFALLRRLRQRPAGARVTGAAVG